MRIQKEQGASDINKQCTYKYYQESKSTGTRHLTKQEIDHILQLPISMQDDYLKSIGKFEMEMC